VAKDFFYLKQAPWTLIVSRDESGKIHHAQLSFIRRSYTIVRKQRSQSGARDRSVEGSTTERGEALGG
jgi:hypothetical protein